jgi:NAD(P)-dependent dehydrogenase (short-subunit alcohol dehydrogenase family)
MALLDENVAVVTGAGRGIGRAVALEFARRGARVFVNDSGVDMDGSNARDEPAREVAELIQSTGARASAGSYDVSSSDEVRAMLASCTRELGEPDILITCHGIARDAPIQTLSEADLNDVLRVHLIGTFHCVQQITALMKRRKGGRIVVSTALSGLLGALGQGAAAAAAGAIHGFARSAAIEVQRHGITLNLVAPLAKTRTTEDLPMFANVDSMTPEHAAAPYVFLASPLCGDRTGHLLTAAGGRVSVVEMLERPGLFKDDAGGVWTPEELAEHWPTLTRR